MELTCVFYLLHGWQNRRKIYRKDVETAMILMEKGYGIRGKEKKKSMYEYQVNALIATQTYVEISSFSNTVKLFLENILRKCLI